ncbi:uncharacterized protein [Henckelia pumila]|uniref:uncharacterized protein n=1 Tax=Henckelia pumila TaxID=405737 RepID=UPI003C6E4786
MTEYDESHDSGDGGRWGDPDDRRRDRHRNREERRRFSMYRFLQMSPKPLVGGEEPGVAKDWHERMENCFREFQCTEDQKMETLDFLLEGNARKCPTSVEGERDFDFAAGTLTIDEYQQKFFELLPYCPQFAGNSEAKFDLFLQGLNTEIHQMFAVGSDITYKDLCGQKEHMKRDFPNLVGVVSGSGGSQASVQQQQPQYQQHPSQQPRHQSQHSQRQHSQTSSRGHSSLRPHVQRQVFALNQKQAEADSDRMIAGTCNLCGFLAYVLIDTGASHSFISTRFAKKYRLPYVPLDVLLVVSTPMGNEVLTKRLVVGCTLEFKGYHLIANLMILAMDDFKCIIGIDLLNT